MVYQRVAHYLWLKGDTYYFNRRVPKDMKGHYKASRIDICLKTTRKDTAVRSAKSIAQRLEDYWLSFGLSKLDIPALHLLRDKPVSTSVFCCFPKNMNGGKTWTGASTHVLYLDKSHKGMVFTAFFS